MTDKVVATDEIYRDGELISKWTWYIDPEVAKAQLQKAINDAQSHRRGRNSEKSRNVTRR